MNKNKLLSIFKNTFDLMLCLQYIYILSSPVPNIVILISSLLFMYLTVNFITKFMCKIEILDKKKYILLTVSTFTVFLFESVLNSSDYMQDLIVNSYLMSFIIFLPRIIYIISTIILFYTLIDMKKYKYIIIGVLLIISSIMLYIEVISSLIPYIYIFAILLIIVLEKIDEYKKRLN